MSLRRAASSKACVPPIQKPIVATAPSTSGRPRDRKSTRLNSSHSQISYAVFCLKKKKDLPLPSLIRLGEPAVVAEGGSPVGEARAPAQLLPISVLLGEGSAVTVLERTYLIVGGH